MIPFAPENAFVFSLFDLLLSGLVFLVSLTLLLQGRREPPPKRLYCLALSFFLFSGHFLLRTVWLLHEMSPQVPNELALPWGLIISGLETGALISLVFVYLPWLLSGNWLARVALALGAGLLVGFTLHVSGPNRLLGPEGGSWQNDLFHILLLTMVLLLYFRSRRASSLFTASPLVVLLLSKGMASMRLLHLMEAEFLYLWNAEHFLKFVGLLLFALVLDRKSRNLYVQVFVRINLISIVVASVLILTIIETERKQYRSFAETNVQDFVEFLRGHILYFHRQGEPPRQILSNPQIIRRIVTEFGHFPDLRQVRLSIGDLRMEMSIDNAGMISQHFAPPGSNWQVPSASPLTWQRVVTLVDLPIYSQRRLVGRVEVDEDLRSINARIALQMRIIFFVFTGLVFVSGLLVGFTVRNANRTIDRQYSELKQANQKLLHTAKLASVGQFVDGIAHEINNPTGIVVARADYLADTAEEMALAPSLREDIEVIRRQANRISKIVRDLLVFSRPSVVKMESTDLNSVVKRTLALVQPALDRRNIELHYSTADSLPPIQGDSDRLEQVFTNIVNNAVDAMPTGGQLRVETGIDHDKNVYVRFTDTGAGIDKEHLGDIFDPFFTTKGPDKGSGLGLAVSYGFIRDHNGSIDVESQPGQGSTFTVRLPRGDLGETDL
ncbi:MAG: ATP-binding protein [Candidatus Binatia bacterium]